MSGFKTFLKLGELPDGSIEGLLESGYEIENCTYAFNQGIDEKGEAQTRVHGGAITLILRQLPTDDLIKWCLDSRKYVSGAIILYDANHIPIEKTFFKDAACVNMKIDYETDGKSYTYTKLTIYAKAIVIGAAQFENDWTI